MQSLGPIWGSPSLPCLSNATPPQLGPKQAAGFQTGTVAETLALPSILKELLADVCNRGATHSRGYSW